MTKKIIALSIFSFFLSAGALVAFAETTTTLPSVKTVNIICVQAAVGVRESAIQAAFAKFSTAVSSALQTRASALSATWSITDAKQRSAAIKSAWANFSTAKQGATKTFRTEKLSAWAQFSKDRKACGATPTGEDLGTDVSL